MMSKESLARLARYGDWADQVLFEAISELPEAAVYQSRNTLFGSMIGTLNHNYQVDLIWRAHLTGSQHGFSTRRDVLHEDFSVLVAHQTQLNQWYIQWIAEQTPKTLAERLDFLYVSGEPGNMTREDMFLHIVNHKTYHRGWVSQMFFEVGVNPPETDLCVFLDSHRRSGDALPDSTALDSR